MAVVLRRVSAPDGGEFEIHGTCNGKRMVLFRESAISLRDQLIEALKEPEIKLWWVPNPERRSLGHNVEPALNQGWGEQGVTSGWYVFAEDADSARLRAAKIAPKLYKSVEEFKRDKGYGG